MTYLSVKSLRRYHDMGLLEPAHINRDTGYRYYEASQVPVGQAIRRFRDLEMPLEHLKEVLYASDAAARNKLIIAHLGSDGALYPNEFFEEELGEVVAFIPVAGMPTPSGRPQLIKILELTGGRGADMVLDTVGGALFEPAVRSLRFGGPTRHNKLAVRYEAIVHVAAIGGPPHPPITASPPVRHATAITPAV